MDLLRTETEIECRIDGAGATVDLASAALTPGMTRLTVAGARRVIGVEALQEGWSLRELRIDGELPVEEAASLVGLPCLKSLLVGVWNGLSLVPLTKLVRLRTLGIGRSRYLRTLSGISEIVGMERLRFLDAPNLVDVSDWHRLGALRSLTLGGVTEARCIADLALPVRLTHLGLRGLPGLTSLKGVEALLLLQTLEVRGCGTIESDVSNRVPGWVVAHRIAGHSAVKATACT